LKHSYKTIVGCPNFFRSVAQSGSAPGLGPGGPRFESLYSDQFMKTIIFTIQKIDGTTLDLEYVPFDNLHSKLWLQGIKTSNSIQWGERVYNLTDNKQELSNAIITCNQTIKNLNSKYSLLIPSITLDNLQQDINFVHTFFVNAENTDLWNTLNWQLHGIEILERNQNKKMQGQIFLELQGKDHYDIPDSSFKYFTTRKKFGYCYANYSHVGRHIFEMYNSQDHQAHNEHIIPMHKISGSSYLWFGNNTSWIYDKLRKFKIKQWFAKNKIHAIIGMQWGNPKLAIGWLPVAKLKNKLNTSALIGCNKVLKITIINRGEGPVTSEVS